MAPTLGVIAQRADEGGRPIGRVRSRGGQLAGQAPRTGTFPPGKARRKATHERCNLVTLGEAGPPGSDVQLIRASGATLRTIPASFWIAGLATLAAFGAASYMFLSAIATASLRFWYCGPSSLEHEKAACQIATKLLLASYGTAALGVALAILTLWLHVRRLKGQTVHRSRSRFVARLNSGDRHNAESTVSERDRNP